MKNANRHSRSWGGEKSGGHTGGRTRWLAGGLARGLAALWLGGCLVSAAGCGRSPAPAASAAASQAPVTAATAFPVSVGGKLVRMELAITPQEMERGLMGRRDLAPDAGMLFLYSKAQGLSFWMRNTPTPLDIGFFDNEGRLVEVYAMHPFDETPVRSRSMQLRFALEMNQGWFKAQELKPGAQLDLKALATAIKARGAQPTVYGLAE